MRVLAQATGQRHLAGFGTQLVDHVLTYRGEGRAFL
jgi:hypothetical protein